MHVLQIRIFVSVDVSTHAFLIVHVISLMRLLIYVVNSTTPIHFYIVSAPGEKCRVMKLFSRLVIPAQKTLKTTNDEPIPVQSMRLLKQMSIRHDCTENQTFGFKGNKVFAILGCRGSFWVCFKIPSTVAPTPLLTTIPPGKN